MKKGIKRLAIYAAVFMGLVFTALSGCQNSVETGSNTASLGGGNGSPIVTPGVLTSFAFKKSVNPFLDTDITGVIDQTAKTVTVTVPVAAYKNPGSKPGDRKFKASFTLSPGARLYKGTREQISGVTEDLFIRDREYRVVAGESSTTYALHIKILSPVLPPAEAEVLKKFYGTYGYNANEKKVTGILNFDNQKYKTVVVCDEEKFISYSLMSSQYTNVKWEKVSETEWTCKACHKKDFTQNTPSVTATFKIGADGKVTCKQVINAMGDAPGNEMPKEDGNYVWAADDGNGFSRPVAK